MDNASDADDTTPYNCGQDLKEVLEKLEPNLNNFMVPTIRSYRKFRQRPFFSVDVKTNKYSYKLQFLTLVPLMNSLEQLE